MRMRITKKPIQGSGGFSRRTLLSTLGGVGLAECSDAAEIIEKQDEEIDRLSCDLAATHRESFDLACTCREKAELLEAARHDNVGLRERTIEEIAQFIENEPIHSWVPRILAERIRALTKPEQKEGTMSMTETIMNQDEKKFWDVADRQADEPHKDPNTPSLEDVSEAVEWDKKCR